MKSRGRIGRIAIAAMVAMPCVVACNLLGRGAGQPKEAPAKAPAADASAKPAGTAPAKKPPKPSCVTAQCHTTLLKGETVHPPAEDCDTCHDAVKNTTHPQKGVKGFTLAQEPADLCTMCHDPVESKKVVHPPAKQGACLKCHNPHSTKLEHLLIAPQKELCGTCHADHLDFKVVHGPVSAGACTTCHAAHSGDKKKLLLKPEEELCLECHTDMRAVMKKADVHPALSGGCTGCHNPHGSANPKMLAEKDAKLCFTCHSDVQDVVEKASVPHPALDAGCPTCHSPHASDHDALLSDSVKEVCTGCHTDVVPKDAKVMHGPSSDGRCTRCHQPHGSNHDTLLANDFPSEPYVPYTDKQFALCFGCHKRDMVQDAQTSSLTNFRDGDKNLHFVHVHDPQKGRSCRMCHSLHGSTGPMLIAETVPFGKWSLPIKYVKTETGGGCSPGCHKPRFYDRKSPGRKPEGMKAEAKGP